MKAFNTQKGDEQVFGPVTRLLSFKKKELILKPEQTERYIYFVLQGCTVMLVEENGTEMCTGYNTEGHFFSAYSSFLKQTPTPTYIKAIEDVRLAAVSFNDLQAAYKLSKEHEKRGRIISEKLYLRSQQRSLDLLTLDAEERYLKFIKDEPEGLQRVPLKYIASYLGITAVSLSRIRKKIVS